MSEVKKPVAKTRGKPPKKSTGKGQTQHKKNDAKKTAQKQSAKTNPLDQALRNKAAVKGVPLSALRIFRK